MSGNTIADARADLYAALPQGSYCPCCDQYAREYKRKLDSLMARCLCWLVSAAGWPPRWVRTLDDSSPPWLLRSGGHLAKLAHWRLIEAAVNEDASKRTSGLWRPTQLGADFAYGNVSIPKYVYTYNNQARRYSSETTDVWAALGDKFDYAELMGER